MTIAHGKPPCDRFSRTTPPRPPHPVPTFVTMANAPPGQDGAAYSFDLPDTPSEIFLQGSLDRANHVDPAQQIDALEQSCRSRFDGHLALTAQGRELVVRVVG
jgi:hypothetical protein